MDLKAWLGDALTIAQLVGVALSLGFGVLVLKLRGEFATVKSVKDLADKVDAHDTRLTKIEAVMPDRDAVGKILERLAELAGDQKATRAELAGLRVTEERAEQRLGRIEDFMMQIKS